MRTLVTAILVCLCAVASAAPPAAGAAPAIPDTPPGRVLRAYLDAFNSGDRARIAAWHARYQPNESADESFAFRQRTGGFDLVDVDGGDRTQLTFRVRDRANPIVGLGTLEVAGDPPKVTAFVLLAIPPGLGAADLAVKVDAAARARVLDGIAQKLTDYYVFPDVAAKMIAAVRARAKKGAYDALDNGYLFAAHVGDDLQAVSHDRHLGVRCVPRTLPPDPANPLDEPPVDAEMRAHMLADNCLFQKVERLDGNIGYVKLDGFMPAEVCGPTATAAMNFLAHVDAVIFDLRDNGGGDPKMVAYLASYLFGARTHLNDLWERKRNRTEQYWTRPEVPGPKLAHQPVYVLTSRGTFSGGEEFTNDLKALKRATIVGETTGGGAHPTMRVRLDDHFFIGVPFARAVNPITKTDWEGKGVAPDVKVPSEQALEVARKLAAEAIAKAAPRK